jgi:hypothetical protein
MQKTDTLQTAHRKESQGFMNLVLVSFMWCGGRSPPQSMSFSVGSDTDTLVARPATGIALATVIILRNSGRRLVYLLWNDARKKGSLFM